MKSVGKIKQNRVFGKIRIEQFFIESEKI